MSFKEGDIVELNSGGPAMTVEKIYKSNGGNESVDCVWFDGVEVKTHTFALLALKPTRYD